MARQEEKGFKPKSQIVPSGQEDALAEDVADAAMHFLKTHTFAEKDQIGCAPSWKDYMEKRVAALIEAPSLAEKLLKVPVIKGMKAFLEGQEGPMMTSAAVQGARHARELELAVSETMGISQESLFCRLYSPSSGEWLHDVFALQVLVGTKDVATQVSPPPHCLAQAILPLEGEVAVVGMHSNGVGGASLGLKLAGLRQLVGTALQEAVQRDGNFACLARPGKVLVVPSGCLLMMRPASSNFVALRWSIFLQQQELEVQRVLGMLVGLLATFPAMEATAPTYVKLRDFLQARYDSTS